jgi:NADPH-dependent 7-cyano-7-deazaguanine reductase QueF-like protein
MNPLYAKLYLAKSIGESIGKSLAKMTIHCDPRYKIEKDSITIYNFSCVDEHGYTDTTDFIELAPTKESYNLLDYKSRKIIINKNTLENKEEREIIINAIRAALIETNQASEMDNIYILKDLSILVASDDWSDNHELLN